MRCRLAIAVVAGAAVLVGPVTFADLARAQSLCDGNGDGQITDVDGVNTLRAAASLSSNCTLATCDTNGDGQITDVDGVNVLRAAAGLSSTCAEGPTEEAPIEDVVSDVVGGDPTVGSSGSTPRSGVLVISAAPVPTSNDSPEVTNLSQEQTAVTNATRAVGVTTSTSAVAAGAAPSLIVAAQGAEGYYELALSADEVIVGVEFPPTLASDDIPLLLATRAGGTVSQYVSLVFEPKDSTTGLDFVQFVPAIVFQDPPDGANPGPDGITISPDDDHVYAGHFGGITVLARNDVTGALTKVQTVTARPSADVAVSPDGAHLYSASNIDDSNALEVFARNGTTGALTFIERHEDGVNGVTGLVGGVGVLVSPDGKHVYVSGHLVSAVAIFARDAATGTLQFLGTVSLASATGQGGAFRAAMSSDGRFLYIPNFNDALVVYERNAQSGGLTEIQTVFGNVGGVSGIEGGFNAELSTDEATLYVAGHTRGTVAAFARNGVTGLLSFVASLQETYRTFSVAPGTGNTFLYATTGDSLTVFRRQGVGGLALEGVVRDSDAGVDGLFGSRDIIVSNDGRHVYVGNFGGDRGMSAFEVLP